MVYRKSALFSHQCAFIIILFHRNGKQLRRRCWIQRYPQWFIQLQSVKFPFRSFEKIDFPHLFKKRMCPQKDNLWKLVSMLACSSSIATKMQFQSVSEAFIPSPPSQLNTFPFAASTLKVPNWKLSKTCKSNTIPYTGWKVSLYHVSTLNKSSHVIRGMCEK